MWRADYPADDPGNNDKNKTGTPIVSSSPRVTWHSHYALCVLALIYVCNYIDRYLVSILIEPIKLEFGVSDTLIGLLTGVAFALFYTVFGLPMGRLADRIGRKPVVALSCIAWSLMTMLCGVATSFAMLLAFRILVAVGEAGGSAPSVAMVADLYPARLRSRALSIFMMGPPLGLALGLGAGGWVAEHYGWRAAFIIIGAPGILIGLLLAFTVKAPRPAPVSTQIRQESFLKTVRSMLSLSSYRLILIAGSLAAVAGNAIGTWNPSFLIRSHGLGIQEAGFLIGIVGGSAAALGTLACGIVTDRLTARDAGWQVGVAALGTLISVPFGLLFFFWPDGVALTIAGNSVPTAFFFYIGFAFFATWWTVPCFGAMSGLFPPAKVAQATALFLMGVTLVGVGLGPLVVGVLSDLYHAAIGDEALRYAMASTIALLLVPVICLSLAVPRYRRQTLDASPDPKAKAEAVTA
ncbi:MFS transporter [Pseudomonas stutzeri]|nr:MFS transporter [Stutzerimonas stutzeri]